VYCGGSGGGSGAWGLVANRDRKWSRVSTSIRVKVTLPVQRNWLGFFIAFLSTSMGFPKSSRCHRPVRRAQRWTGPPLSMFRSSFPPPQLGVDFGLQPRNRSPQLPALCPRNEQGEAGPHDLQKTLVIHDPSRGSVHPLQVLLGHCVQGVTRGLLLRTAVHFPLLAARMPATPNAPVTRARPVAVVTGSGITIRIRPNPAVRNGPTNSAYQGALLFLPRMLPPRATRRFRFAFVMVVVLRFLFAMLVY